MAAETMRAIAFLRYHLPTASFQFAAVTTPYLDLAHFVSRLTQS